MLWRVIDFKPCMGSALGSLSAVCRLWGLTGGWENSLRLLHLTRRDINRQLTKPLASLTGEGWRGERFRRQD